MPYTIIILSKIHDEFIKFIITNKINFKNRKIIIRVQLGIHFINKKYWNEKYEIFQKKNPSRTTMTDDNIDGRSNRPAKE